MKPLTTLIAIALFAPATAAAGPIVWQQVPEHRVNNVDAHTSYTAEDDAAVFDHEYAVERRENQVDMAKDGLRTARDERKQARKTRRIARKELRKSDSNEMTLAAATKNLETAKRSFLESKDNVALQKARIDTRKAHLDLEKGRLARAIAKRELSEAVMLEANDARGTFWHNPKRYSKQVVRMSRKTAERRSDWNLARVDLRETRQDHWGASENTVSFAMPTFPVGMLPGTDVTVTADDNDMSVHYGKHSPTTASDATDLRRVHFDLGSSELDTEALNNLAWNAYVLRNHRDATVRIEGHTDATGSMSKNRALAWDRAEAIEGYLQKQGVWSSQLETAGYGETRPLLETDSATAVNRRADLRVIEDPDGLVDGTIDNDWMDDFDVDVDAR